MVLIPFLFYLLLTLSCLAEDDNISNRIPQTILNLNSCFRYIPDIRLKISAEHVGGTESIQFKDDCLKACIRSLIQRVFVCRSLMHIPTDDDCLLTTTDMNHTEYEQMADFPQSNYYENICAPNPYEEGGVSTEAKFNSFKGGEGIIKFAQKYMESTKALLILDGMKETTKLQIRHYQQNVADCYKLSTKEIATSKPLLETITDSTGMAISPWSNVEIDSNDANILNTLILIIEDEHTIVACGEIRPEQTNHNGTEAGNFAMYKDFSFYLIALPLVISLFSTK